MVAELKECPFCGGDGELYVYTINKGRKLYLVRCENCGNGTCADENVSVAVKLWNARNVSEDAEDAVKTIYISLPRDIDEDEKYSEQKRLAEDASGYLGGMVELREPCIGEECNELEELAARLKSLGEAEYAIFPDEWELERECRIEYTIAGEYGKKILIEHGNKLQEDF